jgi:NAD(P)-dependent dehydrogenase (short-subunit alcohol dehydrogenase family)
LRRHPSGDILSTAPKAGIESVIRGLAREEGRYGVRANAVGVGVIEAGMFHQLDFDDRWVSVAKERIPLGRFGEARDVGDAVVLATQAAYLTGQTLWVDGGYTA